MNINEKVSAINQEILEEARKKKEEMIESEKERMKQKYRDFQEEVNNKEEEIKKSYQQKAERKKEQLISKAILDAKKKKRQKLDQFLANMLQQLEERLINYRHDEDYPDFLGRIIKDALMVMKTKKVFIALNQADQQYFKTLVERLNEDLPEVELNLRDESVNIAGGVLVEASEKNEIVDYSFQASLEMIREELAVEVQQKVLD